MSPRLSPTKKKQLLPESTPTKAQQRLAERERRRQALAGSQPDPYQLIAEQARGCAFEVLRHASLLCNTSCASSRDTWGCLFCLFSLLHHPSLCWLQVVDAAVGEAADAIEERKLVPLWPDKGPEGQPQVYSKIWKVSTRGAWEGGGHCTAPHGVSSLLLQPDSGACCTFIPASQLSIALHVPALRLPAATAPQAAPEGGLPVHLECAGGGFPPGEGGKCGAAIGGLAD